MLPHHLQGFSELFYTVGLSEIGQTLRIGFHISIAKGPAWTLKEARRLNCDVIQIFVKNPRSWQEKILTDNDIESFSRLSRSMPVFAHLTYLPNIARIDEDERHLRGFVHEAELCAKLGIKDMVVHCGSRRDKIRGVEMVSKAINHVSERYDIRILIENSAGQGHSIGSNLDELSQIFERIKMKDRISLCLDTAHLFASGYDIRLPKVWEKILTGVRLRFGSGKIRLFHLNDSRTDLDSGVDRHWHIGKGKIGTYAFATILNDARFETVMGVMETPKIDNMDEENMKVMRSLLSPLVSRPSS